MKKIITHSYECEKCGAIYDTMLAAVDCEREPLNETPFAIGQVVGAGCYGWWNADTSWTLSQLPGKSHWQDVPEDGWAKSPPGPSKPVVRVFRILYRVVGIQPIKGEHRMRIMLWNPRHSNCNSNNALGYGEMLAYTATKGHIMPHTVPAELWPTLTQAETDRMNEIIASPPWREAGLL